MKLSDDVADEELVLNLTSMTDIVFLMLVFFMLATTFADPESRLGLELPKAESERRAATEELVIAVLEDGTTVLSGRTVECEELRQRLSEVGRDAPATPVTIRGHKLARHEAIVAVLDACALAGLTNLSVGTARGERG